MEKWKKSQTNDQGSQDQEYASPQRIFFITIVGIFVAEVIAMIVVYFFNPQPYWFQTLVDASFMTIIIFPIVYFYSFRTLLIQIAERKHSERLLSNVLENLPVGVWITDKNGKIMHGNPASQQIWAGARYVGIEGYGEYKGWWADGGERIEPQEWAGARAITQRETSLNEEVEIECFDGSHKIILNSAIPIFEEGAIQGAIIVNQDITERKRYEQALVHSNELIESAFNSIDILIAYMDREFNFIRVNEMYARAGGQPVDFFTGKNHFDLYPHEENQAIFQRVVETGEPISIYEKPFKYEEYPERGVTYWNWGLQPIKGAEGEVQGVVLSLVDVTQRKRAEEQLERQNQELRALSIAERKLRELAETLSAVSLALSRTLNLETVMNTLLEFVCRLIPYNYAYIAIAENESSLTVRAAHGYEPEADPTRGINTSFDAWEIPYLQAVFTTQKTLLIPDTQEYPGWTSFLNGKNIRNWLGIPVVVSGKAIGILAMANYKPCVFTGEHVQLAEGIVTQASVAIQNAWLFEQVRAGHERLQSLSRRLVEVQESERRYIARELHDEASQALTALKFGLRLLEQEVDHPESVRARLADLKQLTDKILEELHRLAMDLRPASLDHLGLVATLEQLVKGADERYNRSVRFKAAGFSSEVRLAGYLETALYRIVQEALTNAARHANANNIDVILELRDGKAVVIVEDDGVGFDTAMIRKSGHLGLLGMQERAEMMGGAFQIESRSGGGTTVVVEVPYVDPNIDRR